MDGLEAVQKAEAFRPDVILLGIGLLKLNGIDTARQILVIISGSRISFLSQESSASVVAEALSVGARGYVLKVRAESDLLAAVEAVLSGGQFVSCDLIASIGCSISRPLSRALGFPFPYPFASPANSLSGIANSVKPQSMQTRSFGNMKTPGLFRPSHPLKWTLISALNLRLLSEEHDLHIIASLLCKTLAYDVPELAMI